MWVTSSLTTVLTPTAVALGNFDGIHLGHRQVVQSVLPSPLAISANQAPAAGQRTYATVVTFYPHPQEFFTGESRPLLTPLHEKAVQLSTIGVEQLILLPFNRELASLTPEQFVEDVLIRKLQVQHISVGQDFCFGRQRAGTAELLQTIARQHGIDVSVIELKNLHGDRISSSAIRQALQEGDLALANRLLGRSYQLVGQVVQGQQLGRTLGFPTANLQLPAEKFLPRLGSYAVRVSVCQSSRETDLLVEAPLLGVMNIGYRPTVNGVAQTVEVHVLDWAGDLYGKTLVVNMEKFLRSEQRFASLDDLKAQIQLDCEMARTLLTAPDVTPEKSGQRELCD